MLHSDSPTPICWAYTLAGQQDEQKKNSKKLLSPFLFSKHSLKTQHCKSHFTYRWKARL